MRRSRNKAITLGVCCAACSWDARRWEESRQKWHWTNNWARAKGRDEQENGKGQREDREAAPNLKICDLSEVHFIICWNVTRLLQSRTFLTTKELGGTFWPLASAFESRAVLHPFLKWTWWACRVGVIWKQTMHWKANGTPFFFSLQSEPVAGRYKDGSRMGNFTEFRQSILHLLKSMIRGGITAGRCSWKKEVRTKNKQATWAKNFKRVFECPVEKLRPWFWKVGLD